MKRRLVVVGLIFLSIAFPGKAFAKGFWPVTAIDTMKFSRDISREPDVLTRIPTYVAAVAALHPTHIAIATPYDEEFYPVLNAWVTEARKYHLSVWFRGNWSSWEGWFGYPKFTDITDHHKKTREFILKHKELFRDGDIFTPVPEAENGGAGDPRGSDQKASAFRTFLVDSYSTCVNAFSTIGSNVSCGYFSVNGDVARDVFTKDMVRKTGNVVVIDHYVKTPEKLAADIQYLHDKYDAPIVLGEYGAPIPDIHGTMTEAAQAEYIANTLEHVIALGDTVTGVNYWTAFGGSTALFTDALEPKRVANTIQTYYNPPILTGNITDQFGRSVPDATVYIQGSTIKKHTDVRGKYDIPLTDVTRTLVIEAPNFKTERIDIASSDHDVVVKNIVLEKTVSSPLTALMLSIQGIFLRFLSLFGQ
jgi:hypothetical protein